jgi:hypothetical protein
VLMLKGLSNGVICSFKSITSEKKECFKAQEFTDRLKFGGKYMNDFQNWGWYMVSLSFSIGANIFVLRPFVDRMWSLIGWECKGGVPMALRPYAWTPVGIGIIEAVLYPVSLLMNRPEFIAIWLAAKVAGQFELSPEGNQIPARTRYNIFLIGSGLSILFGVVSAFVARWLSDGLWLKAIALGVLVIFGTIAFRFLLVQVSDRLSKKAESV